MNEQPREWIYEDEVEAALKPCVRCGGKAILDDGMGSGIHCDDCGQWTGEDMYGDESIEWWNKQPRIDDLTQQLATLAAELGALRAENERLRAAWRVAVESALEQQEDNDG